MPDASIPIAPPDAEAIRHAAQQVIAQSKYGLGRQPANYDWLRERIERFFDILLKPVEGLFDALASVSPVLAWVIVAGLTIVLVALLVHIGYSWISALRLPGGALPPPMREAKVALSPEEWEARARRAAGEREFTEAARCLLRAALLRLALQRRRPFRPGATNREYLRLLRNSPAAPPLSGMIEIVDRRWFAGDACSESDFEQCSEAHRRIREATEAPPHAQLA